MALPGADFELECFNYLQQAYGSTCLFEYFGQADSTQSDIRVTAGPSSFYIEVKDARAQSGQFVLLPNQDEGKFIFSPRNKTSPNELTAMITDYMNADFPRFNAAGTAGQPLDIDPQIFHQWIIRYYESKKVRYFMSKAEQYVFIPLHRFGHYFDVTAKFRIKRSGSGEPSPGSRSDVCDVLALQYGLTDTEIRGKKLFTFGDDSVNKIRFTIGNYEYYLSPKTDNRYEVRRLSNTYNMNVIFSISLKATQDPADLRLFEQDVRL